MHVRRSAAETVAGSTQLFQLVSQSLAALVRSPAAVVVLFLPFAIVSAVGGEILDRIYPGMTGADMAAYFSRLTFNEVLDVLAAIGVLWLVQFYFYLKAAIGWHRYLLLGERPWSRGLRLGRIERRYISRTVAITLLVVLGMFGLLFVFWSIGGALSHFVMPWRSGMSPPWAYALLWVRFVGFPLVCMAISILFVGIIVLRFSVTLVERALDRDSLDFRDAWDATTSWRGPVVVFVIVAGIAAGLASFLDQALENLMPGLAGTVVSVTISTASGFCLAALHATAITLLYREATRRTEDVFD